MKLLMIVFIINEMLREQEEEGNSKQKKYLKIKEAVEKNPDKTPQEIADMIGTTRDYVMRVMRGQA